MDKPALSISVVSHRHGPMVAALLDDIARVCREPIDVILTLNVDEDSGFIPRALPFSLEVIRNATPRGFGANHNAAFRRARAEHFCVLNPDVRLEGDPFPALLDVLKAPEIAVVAPMVRNPRGAIEDSARRFPTPGRLLRKLIGGPLPLDYTLTEPVIYPDWVAGMAMVFRKDRFAALGGFDQGYFLYYEDVDLCARIHSLGQRVALVTSSVVIHDARRASRRDLRHALWHLRSVARYFWKARHGFQESSPSG